MKHFFQTQRKLRVSGTGGSKMSCYLDVRALDADGGYTLSVTLYPIPDTGSLYHEGLDAAVTYNGVTKPLAADEFIAPVTVEFPYDDSVRQLTLGSTDITNPNGSVTTEKTFTWRGSVTEPDPVGTFSCEGLHSNGHHTVAWTWGSSVPNRECALVNLRAYYLFNGNETWKYFSIFADKITDLSRRLYVSEIYPPGTLVYYKAIIGAYEHLSDGWEDVMGLCEITSPVYTITGNYTPYPPYELNYRMPAAGAPLRITWNKPVDSEYPASRYELQRSLNGGSYTMLYLGNAGVFTDVLPRTAETVAYRVRARGDSSSVFRQGEVLSVAQSNLYVGVGGVPRAAVGLYLGQRQAIPMLTVGGV